MDRHGAVVREMPVTKKCESHCVTTDMWQFVFQEAAVNAGEKSVLHIA